MRRVKLLGDVITRGKARAKGEVLRGLEHDLMPLVDCGVAEWADLPEEAPVEPEKKPSGRSKKKQKKPSTDEAG